MNNIFEKKFGLLPANFIVLSIFFFIGSIVLLFFYSSFWHIVFGILCLISGIFIISIQTGIIIDFSKKKVLKYWGPFNYKIGKWVDVSNIKYIAVVSVRLRAHFSTKECVYTTMGYKGRINVISHNNKYFTLYDYKRDQALKDALTISNGFNVRLYDNSEGKKQWINKA